MPPVGGLVRVWAASFGVCGGWCLCLARIRLPHGRPRVVCGAVTTALAGGSSSFDWLSWFHMAYSHQCHVKLRTADSFTLRREPWRGKSTGWAEPPASQRVLGVLFELLSHPFKSRRAHQTHSHHIACCRAMTTRPHGWLRAAPLSTPIFFTLLSRAPEDPTRRNGRRRMSLAGFIGGRTSDQVRMDHPECQCPT